MVSNPGRWYCAICTYDNDESFQSCDICGVFRDSSFTLENNDEKKVGDACKDFGASSMAKALFTRPACRRSKATIIFDNFLNKELNISYEKGSAKARFDDLHKTFVASNCKQSMKIVRFRFDTLSPDDVVSLGKNYSRIDSKVPSATSRTSSSITGQKGRVKFSPKSENLDSSPVPLALYSHQKECDSRSFGENGDESQTLASNLKHLKIDKKSTDRKRATSLAKYKPEKWTSSDQEQGILSQLNLAIVGHVDSGKSTLCGRMLHLLGKVSKKVMHKYEKEAKEKGKGSFSYAWAMDESSEERERGVTMTVGLAYFESKNYRVVLLDSPGHKDFVPNMIAGATQADAAILVVDACTGSFEAGMDGHGIGQTREHAQLIRSFGVEQIIVAVNKMDVVEYAKERFDYIKLQLSSFLQSCGFREPYVTWIPLSAMENQNLVTSASDIRLSSWYQGFCLLDAIDTFVPPQRDIEKPLLLPICDVVTSRSLGQLAACGKLETGAIRSGSKVLVMPSGDLTVIRSIERDSCPCNVARAGDSVAVSLQGIHGDRLIPGGVLCHPEFPVNVASCLELKILVLEITTPILVGSQIEFHIHHAKTAARVVKILSLIDKKIGEANKKPPRFLTAKQRAVIEVALDEPVCVEEFSNCRALGRAFLRASGNTVAVGIVSRVMEPEP